MSINFDSGEILSGILYALIILGFVCLGVFILVKIVKALNKRLKNVSIIVKILTIIGTIVVLYAVVILIFWVAFILFWYATGKGPMLH